MPITTFITSWGQYCFNMLPYGISFGSNKFQKCKSRILKRLKGVTLNLDKCIFGVPKIKFPGKVVNADGIKVVPENVATVVSLSRPKTVDQVSVFSGMVHGVGKFAEHLAGRTKPIQELMKKD